MDDKRSDNKKMGQFALYWTRSQGVVESYIYGCLRDWDTTQDLTQQVALDAADHFERYDPASPFTAWVLGIARHRVLKQLRHSRRDRHVFDNDLIELLTETHQHMADRHEQTLDAMRQCLDELPPRSRRVIQMRYLQEMTTQQIATSVDGTKSMVYMLLFRARSALSQCIEKKLRLWGRADA